MQSGQLTYIVTTLLATTSAAWAQTATTEPLRNQIRAQIHVQPANPDAALVREQARQQVRDEERAGNYRSALTPEEREARRTEQESTRGQRQAAGSQGGYGNGAGSGGGMGKGGGHGGGGMGGGRR